MKTLKNLKSLAALFIAFQLCVLSAFSQDDKMKSKKELKETIEKLNKEMEKAFNDNDMMKVAAFYSDDAEISGDTYTVRGRKNLDSYWMALKDLGRGWKLEVFEIGGEGDLVYQLGKSDLKYMNKGAEVRSVVNFIVLWKRSADGTYKMYRDYITDMEFVKSEKK